MKNNIGIIKSDGSHVELDPNFNIAMSEEVSGVLNDKIEYIKRLKKYNEDIKAQAEREAVKCKEVVGELIKENMELEKKIKEYEMKLK